MIYACVDQTRVMITYRIPLAEIVYDFFDKLKSSKRLCIIRLRFRWLYESRLMGEKYILLNGVVDALSVIVHRDFALSRNKAC